MSRRTVARPAAPRHRASRSTRLLHALRTRSALAGVVVAATASAVTVGVAATADEPAPATAATAAIASMASGQTEATAQELREMERSRKKSLSRSDRRTGVDRTKADRLSRQTRSGGQVTRDQDLGGGDPRTIARILLPEFGFSADQFSCLDSLWTKESGWNPAADNPTSSAYGIPQALPGEKMASAGADWATNPATQIRWGLGYIAEVYGSPCGAWSHSQANNWY